MRSATNLIVIILAGVIIADLIAPGHIDGTKALFNGVSNLWATSVNGMLGNAPSGGTSNKPGAKPAAQTV